MKQSKKEKGTKSIFEVHFKEQEFSKLLKNFFVQLPRVEAMPEIRITFSHSIDSLMLVIKNIIEKIHLAPDIHVVPFDQGYFKQKTVVDFQASFNHLEVILNNTPEIKFESINLNKLLDDQALLVRSLLAKQQVELRKEANALYREELQNIRNSKKRK